MGADPPGRTSAVSGRLVLEDHVASGTISVADGVITAIDLHDDASSNAPLIAPGYVDVHVHGWGGHDAMGDERALNGMARALLSHGVTSFLPTAVTAPTVTLTAFAERVRDWLPKAPDDGSQPLGFNLEGPFLSDEKRGAHAHAHLLVPKDTPRPTIEPWLDGLRLITVAPELAGATDLIAWLHDRGVVVSVGHSAATLAHARAGYAAGATSTTHLFNAMSGADHREPGVAVAALIDDDVFTELIADGIHVDRALWPLITRAKPVDRLVLVSDALPIAGTGDGRGRIGGLDIEVVGARATLAGTSTLAGSVIALDSAVRNLVSAGIPLPDAIAAATRNPLALLGVSDRGRIAVDQRADLVELDDGLAVRRVMRGGTWSAGASN